MVLPDQIAEGLRPVFEGERGFGGAEGVVMLGSNSVQVVNVQTELVTNRVLSRTLRVAGVIDDDDTRHRRLSAYAEGRIEKLFVNHVGAEVVEGQPLAVLYSPALLTAESEYLTLVRQGATRDQIVGTVEKEYGWRATGCPGPPQMTAGCLQYQQIDALIAELR